MDFDFDTHAILRHGAPAPTYYTYAYTEGKNKTPAHTGSRITPRAAHRACLRAAAPLPVSSQATC